MQSVFGKLNLLDILKGALLAFITAIVAIIYPIVTAGELPDFSQWHIWIGAGVAAFIAYLFKNLFQNSDGVPFTKEQK